MAANLYWPGSAKPTRREDQITGAVTRLPSITIDVWHITVDSSGNFVSAALDSVTPHITSDSNGNVSASYPVGGAVGDLYRLVMLDDGQKRCRSWDQLAEA
jgi:hypothetical protein